MMFFLVICLLTILLLLKLFGEVGIFIYTVIAIISANIQVLKIVEFPFFSNPIALGTILFSSTFLATDILTEYYGSKIARRNILIGFVSFLIMTLFMLFTIGFTPLGAANAEEDLSWALSIQDHFLRLKEYDHTCPIDIFLNFLGLQIQQPSHVHPFHQLQNRMYILLNIHECKHNGPYVSTVCEHMEACDMFLSR